MSQPGQAPPPSEDLATLAFLAQQWQDAVTLATGTAALVDPAATGSQKQIVRLRRIRGLSLVALGKEQEATRI